MRPLRMDRRTLLRGAGAAIALPLLDAMLDGRGRAFTGEACAQPVPAPPRLVTWFIPHGTVMDSWTPATEGAGWALTPCLMPLGPHQGDLVVLTGFANTVAQMARSAGGPHSRSVGSLFNAQPPVLTGATGATIERVAATRSGGGTRFRSLAVNPDTEQYAFESGTSALLSGMAWDGPGQPVPYDRDPQALFDKLFAPVPGPGDPAGLRRASVLDHVQAELTRLQASVGTADRARLDQHATALRELEHQLSTPAMCTPPARPGSTTLSVSDRARLMMDLLVLALRCDLTRYASFALANGQDNQDMGFLGITGRHHDLTHQGDPGVIQQITQYEVGQLAYFLAQMKAVRDPDGHTLLDRSLVLALSEISNGSTHDYQNLPAVLAGGSLAGVHTGIHRRVPDGTPVANLYLTVLNLAGVPVTRFGADGTATVTGLSG